MRKIATLIPLLALGAAPPAEAPLSPSPAVNARAFSPFPDCRTPYIASANDRATFNRLGDLPPAEAYQAVLRAGPDGCSDPLLVRDRVRQSGRR